MKKILVVGQTPPPYGGQAVMIKYMLDSQYTDIKMYNVRICFSREFDARGKLSVHKILHIFTIIYRIWIMKFRHNIDVMYYPPSSTPKIAVLRDVIILGFTRFLFKKNVFHFHASGISEELPKYNILLRTISYNILKKPYLAITSSEFNPNDGVYLQARKNKIIPLGIPDNNVKEERKTFASKGKLKVLFIGLLNSTKGEGYVLDAIYFLQKKGMDIDFYLAGKFESEEYRKTFFNKVDQYNLMENVHYKGIVKGKDKHDLFLKSDVFCFPSFFSSESFGIVLLEAMMYQMPLIASRWRGIQSVVKNGVNGYLVDVQNSEQIAIALELLYTNRNLLQTMSQKSRQIFCEEYVLSKYITRMEEALNNI